MPTAAMSPHEKLILSLSRTIDEVIRPLLGEARVFALLDFPNHPNVGDAAIWLGEKASLRRMGRTVGYACDETFSSTAELQWRLKDGIILLTGGGNLGDVWPARQHWREEVIAAFPDKKILQLPQTIYFTEKANVERAKGVFDRHPDLTILVRDHRSLDFARNEFRARSVLCPDMAFALGALRRPEEPGESIVWVSRSDKESTGQSLPPLGQGVDLTDWMEDNPSAYPLVDKCLTRLFYRHPSTFRRLSGVFPKVYDRFAKQRVRRGCRLLSRGRVVITDRLHGHILGLLLGIPHVILDNSYGKLRTFYETWTKGCGLAVWADSPAEALAAAEGLKKT
jgi:pyruvyl transferase EpsO